MIYEQRTYQTHPGKAPDFLQLYEEEGLKIITRHALLAGCWVNDSGALDLVTFLWAYKDHGHRSDQNAKLDADPDWRAFVPKVLPLVAHRECVVLKPAVFSPLI